MTDPGFRLNGRDVAIDATQARASLLRWLRSQHLTGTKEGCADGDCGACTVALVEYDPDGTPRWRAVNSCLLPMGMLAGREVLTVEALAADGKLHPVQQAMVDCAGSQCGYCTPGFVMSLFAAQHNGERGDAVFEGNLCRCTGYVPIRAAAERIEAVAADDRFGKVLTTSPPLASTRLGHWFNPLTLDEALQRKSEHPDAVWIAGGTDLGVDLSHGKPVAETFIALDRIDALRTIEVSGAGVRIGAGVPLSRIERELGGRFPSLDAMLPWFAARQVRNRATFGGNLGSASPIGDLLPVLLALDAIVHLRGPSGARDIASDDFFLDYRKTARGADEIVVAVTLPQREGWIDASYKVAKRQHDDISIVAAAFAIDLDAERRVRDVRLAYGGVAAIPRRARAVEEFLRGRRLDADTMAQTETRLRDEFTPLDDHRASADYRRSLCAALFARFVAEQVA